MNKMVYVAIIAAIAAGLATAINPTTQAYAQNSVTATQSNSFTADISQSATNGGNGGSISQGFCLSVNQQNAAAGDDVTNTGSNSISGSDCS
jgi:orotate phosphoribosyltransferase-like protein